MQKYRWVQIALVLLVLIQSFPTLNAATSSQWSTFRFDSGHSGFVSGSDSFNSALLLWNYSTGAGVVSSPAIVCDELFVGSKDCNVYCLNASTGSLIWSFATAGGVESSPAVSNCYVYVGSNDGWIYCLNKTSGNPIWISLVGGVVVSSPLIVNDFVFVGSGEQGIFCFNALNGSLVWKFQTTLRVDSSPAILEGVLYFATDDFCVYALNSTTGAQIWKQHTGSVSSSPSLSNGYLYIGSNDGYVCCLNASDGKVVWRYLTEGCVVCSPAVAYGYVFVGSEDNKVYCLNATDGSKIWQTATGYWIDSSPVVFGGNVYLGSEDYSIYCLDALTGKKLWSWPTDNAVDSSPSIVEETLYVGSCDNNIYAFTLTNASSLKMPEQKPIQPFLGTVLFDATACIVFGGVLFAVFRIVFYNRQPKKMNSGSKDKKQWFFTNIDPIFIIIILSFALIFFLNLANGPLWTSDEQTYSQWAYHMVKNGDYLTPYAFGSVALWIGKPPFYTWLLALGYQAFGVSNFVTRMWSPIFAALTMVCVYFLGREVSNRYVGLISSLLLGTSVLFYSFARHAMTDIVFVFFVVASVYFFVLSEKNQGTLRPIALSGLFFGLALLTKQVEALLIPLIVVIYFAIYKKSLRFLFTKRFALFWGTGLIILAPWLFYMFANFGNDFWNWFVVYCGFLRVINPLEGHEGGYLFYFDYLVRNETIWAIFLPFAVGLCAYRFAFKKSKADTLLVSWIIVVFLIFSFAQTKLAWYILPAFPAFALAIGGLFYQIAKKILELR